MNTFLGSKNRSLSKNEHDWLQFAVGRSKIEGLWAATFIFPKFHCCKGNYYFVIGHIID